MIGGTSGFDQAVVLKLFPIGNEVSGRGGFEQGWFREGDARLYVSRGVGVTFLPIRIDARPEIRS
jgi:predicted MPP superfamily phosphohydrolase